MNCSHIQWVARTLTEAQNGKRADGAGSMLETPESHAASNFHFLGTDDESWMFHQYHHETTWGASWEEVDELERPTDYHRRRIVTAFFNCTGQYLVNILPRSRCIDTKYFAQEILSGLEDVCYPEERNPRERKITLHFDNAPVHNTGTVIGQLKQSWFKRTEHPAYSLDPAPYDIFLFSHMKEQVKGWSIAEEQELLSVLSEVMSEIPPDMILWVFGDWNQTLWFCLLMEGKHVE
jgi:hypothetical protein